MYPWARMMKAAVAFAGASRSGLLETTRVSMRVWPNDLDFNLHVNNGRYLTLADIGRVDWFVRTGVLRLARQRNAIPVVGDAIAKFRRELRMGQRFEIHSRLLGWDERWGFLEHRFYRAGRVVGVVAIRGVFRAPEGPLEPGSFLGGLGVQMTSPALPQWVAQWHYGSDALSQVLREEEQAQGVR